MRSQGGLIPENGDYNNGATIQPVDPVIGGAEPDPEPDSNGSDSRDDDELESRLNPWLDRHDLRREDVIMLAAMLQAASVIVAMYIEVNS